MGHGLGRLARITVRGKAKVDRSSTCVAAYNLIRLPSSFGSVGMSLGVKWCISRDARSRGRLSRHWSSQPISVRVKGGGECRLGCCTATYLGARRTEGGGGGGGGPVSILPGTAATK